MDELLAGSPDDVELVQNRPTAAEVALKSAQLESMADGSLQAREAPTLWDLEEESAGAMLEQADEILSELPSVLQIPEGRRNWFFQVLARTAAASALAYIGDSASASRYATWRQLGAPDPNGLLVPDESGIEDYSSTAGETFRLGDDLVFEGSRHVTSFAGGHTLEIWRGLERGLYAELGSGHLGRYFRQAPRLRQRWQSERPHSEFGVASVGNDGTALAMRVS